MKYKSTRSSSISCSFEEAICSGYAPDGGLFIPEILPKIDSSMLVKWSTFTYPDLAWAIMRMFISSEEVSDDELRKICHDSFVKGFGEDTKRDVIPVRKLGSSYLVELFHGPTFCFKDFGMRALVNILSFFATKRKKSITLLVSTTGDTGPAAVQAVSDAENELLRLLVHYPLGQISAFQRKQLTTVKSPSVKVATFEGGGDDMDLPIKRMLSSSLPDDSMKEVKIEKKLCGVNSYNIGRPLVQMIHFIWTYLRVIESTGASPDDGSQVDIILPTGAMGNIAGGYMAKKMGVPVGRLCAGVNINDITHRVVESGKFYKSERMEKTLSDAINIQVPYNFERLLFYLTDQNHTQVKNWMETMEITTKLDLDSEWHEKLQNEFSSARITDEEMCMSMQKVYNKFNYCIDPHTAVAVATAEKLGYNLYSDKDNDRPYAILSTASPCKFEESVTIGIGEENWETYYNSKEKDGFPERARLILEKEEVKPYEYKWKDGESLDQIQVKWEKLAKELVDGFSSR